MDQDLLVNDQIESGNRLIQALAHGGFDVRFAFWAKPTEDEKWFFYLVLPFVDNHGAREAYQLVHGIMRKSPDVWIDPLDIKVVGLNDSIAKAAAEITRPIVTNSQFAAWNSKTSGGITRFDGSSLGGISIDGAYFYPPSVTGTMA
jgi:hypothetical protein